MLTKGKLFSKLDLSQAYQQLPLDDRSKEFGVINTHKGLFRFTRLPFGVSSASSIFQRVIETILQGIQSVVVYLDDILITVNSDTEHLSTLEEVFRRLQQAGLRVKLAKCEFMKPSITYLGHRIDDKGLHPLQDKVEAIHDAPTPKSVQEFWIINIFIIVIFFLTCPLPFPPFIDYYVRTPLGCGKKSKRGPLMTQKCY